MIDLGIGNLRIKKAGKSGIYALFKGEELESPLTNLEEHLAAMIEELEQRLAASEADMKRLRGQLQHCVQQLNRANRDARDRNEYTNVIDSANRAIYEIFECKVKEVSGSEGE